MTLILERVVDLRQTARDHSIDYRAFIQRLRDQSAPVVVDGFPEINRRALLELQAVVDLPAPSCEHCARPAYVQVPVAVLRHETVFRVDYFCLRCRRDYPTWWAD